MTPLSPWRTFSALSRQPKPWICRECLQTPQPRIPLPRPFSTTQQLPTQAGKRTWRKAFKDTAEWRKVAITVTLVFVAGSTALAFSERARHAYLAAQRSGRVGVTLALCVNDYYWVLKKDSEPNYKSVLSACHKRCAERTLRAMEANGSIFIKLGQHLSSLNYILPSEWCDTFVPLQDHCPVSSYSSIEDMVLHDTGKKLDEYFSDFARRPVGAASLAQVHTAILRSTGEKVAVKVQHPSLDEWSKLDLWLTRFTFSTLRYWFPEYDLTWLSDEMEESLPKELDFREEGRNAQRAKEYFSHIPRTPLVIPEVIWAERRLLVMEYISGHRPDDLEFLDSNGIDRDEVSAALARIFNEMIFGRDAPLHCDPHGGNLAIRLNPSRRKPRNFDIVLYDHGLYRDIPLRLRRAYAHIWLAVLDVDEANMRKYAYEIAGLNDDEFPIFASAITGRDFRVVKSEAGVAQSRSESEKRAFSDALGAGGLLSQVVFLLAKVPRVILLILKTNDLTRSLDEKLQTREGPVRTFMILARYAARSVFEESVEGIKGSVLWPGNLWAYSVALAAYAKVAVKLRVYELYLSGRRRLGLRAELIPAAAPLVGTQSPLDYLKARIALSTQQQPPLQSPHLDLDTLLQDPAYDPAKGGLSAGKLVQVARFALKLLVGAVDQLPSSAAAAVVGGGREGGGDDEGEGEGAAMERGSAAVVEESELNEWETLICAWEGMGEHQLLVGFGDGVATSSFGQTRRRVDLVKGLIGEMVLVRGEVEREGRKGSGLVRWGRRRRRRGGRRGRG
ncbi:hypothetical protein B0A55_02997 [Friedmanniomyces simplex]|uniref:ABC1 atypical kinase-like domain-containing protein n=1 Tax=Friedmanniomyces simplex TaxID=329884 RepID=A0A4U0XYQ7_9PEZI|nr:hypothetical protein B0A55_02997 [Friedmanniomyces simplex]